MRNGTHNKTARVGRGNIDNLIGDTPLPELNYEKCVFCEKPVGDTPILRGVCDACYRERFNEPKPTESIEANVSAVFMQAGPELGTRWIVSGGQPYEITDGVSSPAWFDQQEELPF